MPEAIAMIDAACIFKPIACTANRDSRQDIHGTVKDASGWTVAQANHNLFADHDQTFSVSGGTAYKWGGFVFTIDGLYSSGPQTGFANTGNQPLRIQFNAGIVKSLKVPSAGNMEARAAVINRGGLDLPVASRELAYAHRNMAAGGQSIRASDGIC